MSVPAKNIAGDVAVGRHVTTGGDANIRGNAKVDRNLRVSGWLEAKNIKGVNKGLFMTLDDLKESYPKSENGWIALVGATVPAPIYVGRRGEWVATGESGGELILDMAQYDQALSNLSDDIAREAGSRIKGDEVLQSNIDSESTARSEADTTLQQSINAEASARSVGEAAILNKITQEASTRAASDGRLESMYNSLRDDFGTEASERANADNELRAAIRLLERALDDSEDGTFAQSTNEMIRELWSKINQLVSDLDHTQNDIDALVPIEVQSEEAMDELIASGRLMITVCITSRSRVFRSR